MQLKQLEYFIKIVECGSISQAAKQLYISQPSLTKAVFTLETEYNIKLLVRKARGIELTQEGKDFVYYAKGVLAAANVMNRYFNKQEETEKSRLFIASQQLEFIHPLFLEIYQKNKDWDVHYGLMEMDRKKVIESVLKGENDIGVFVHSNWDPKPFLTGDELQQLEMHVLDRADVYLAVGPKSPLYDKKTVTFQESEKYLHILLDMEAQARQAAYFEQTVANFSRNKTIFFNTMRACEYFLMETDAILFIAKWAMGCIKNSGIRFIRVKEDNEQIKRYTELVWIKRKIVPLNATEQEFIRRMEEMLAEKKKLRKFKGET